MRYGDASCPDRTEITEPMVMASAPGGTGPPTRTTAPGRRSMRIIASRASPGPWSATSEEAAGELAPVGGRAGVLGPHELQDVDVLLAGALVLAHPLEQRRELGVVVVGRLLADARQRRDVAHPLCLRHPGQQGKSLLGLAPLHEDVREGHDD